jgi:hypothetical protein
VTARVAAPTGELLLYYVEREEDATIEQADIYDGRVFGGFAATTSAASLTPTISGGLALVGNQYVRHTGTNTVTLTASETNSVWVRPDGTFSVTIDGSRPVERALLLWTLVTDGSGVTTETDCRTWIGRGLHTLWLGTAGTLAASDYSDLPTLYPGRRAGFLRPVGGVQIGLDGTGTTSGSTKVDVEYSAAGGAWTSIWPSSGTVDLRPTVAYNATDPTSRSAPIETYSVAAGSRFRSKVIAIPGGADSSGLTVALLIEEAP